MGELQEGVLKNTFSMSQNRKYFCTHKESIGSGLCMVRHSKGQLLSRSTNTTTPGSNPTVDGNRGLSSRHPVSIAKLVAWGGSRRGKDSWGALALERFITNENDLVAIPQCQEAFTGKISGVILWELVVGDPLPRAWQ